MNHKNILKIRNFFTNHKNKFKQENKTFFNYLAFLFKIIFKKKNTWIIPLILLLIQIIFITLTSISYLNNYFEFINYFLFFIQLILTIIFSSIKAVNIFNDLEKNGIEIIIFSKKITRKQIIWGKILFFQTLILIWTLLIFLLNIVYLLINKNKLSSFNDYFLWSFFSIFATGLIFGFFTSLISYKFSYKVALTLPLLLFAPLIAFGTIISSISTSIINETGKILKIEHKPNDSNQITNTENFYLNNNKDELFLAPKKFNNLNFSKEETKLLDIAFQNSQKTDHLYWSYSWLSLPYQLINVFETNEQKTFKELQGSEKNNLENYLYYKSLEDKNFNYKLNKEPSILKLNTINNNKTSLSYLIPGAFKVQTHFQEQANTKIIYARENAQSFDVQFLEDNYTFGTPDNLVGKLNQTILKEALQSEEFINHAKTFYNKLLNQTLSKKQLLEKISNAVDEKHEDLGDYIIDNQTVLFNENQDTKLVKNKTEKKVYIATALIYFLYYTYNDSDLLKTLLKNDDPKLEYNQDKIKISINNNNYFIGGYESFLPIQQVNKDNKIIYRFQLNESNNFLFQPVNEIYSIQKTNKVVQKKLFPLIWFSLIFLLIGVNYKLYSKKDYK